MQWSLREFGIKDNGFSRFLHGRKYIRIFLSRTRISLCQITEKNLSYTKYKNLIIPLCQISCGKNEDIISTTIPMTSTAMVLGEQPFHSLSIMPHTFENTTFSAISMQNESVIRVGDSVRKPLPMESPKNWLYHNAPAKAQNSKLLPHTLPFL